MRTVLRALSLAVLLGGAPMGPAAHAGEGCRAAAIAQLRTAAPDGAAVYAAIGDKAFFSGWITCEDAALGLSTAVHESVHYITEDRDAFPLLDGGEIRRPHEVSRFYAPALMAGRFKGSDFATTYLRPGESSSATDFLYLLDELNAYTHDLQASIDLRSLRPAGEDVDSRDGLAALMAFVARYVETARNSQPSTWAGLQARPAATTLAALWDRAERVMTSSCGIPDFGAEDRTFLRQVCDPRAEAALGAVIGHAPVCPRACLTEPTDDPAVDASPARSAAHLSAVRLFWQVKAGHRPARPGLDAAQAAR